MALFESLIKDSGKTEKKPAGFSVTMIHYSKLIPSENNNYSMESIKELAQMIVLAGKVEQNLLARKKTPDEYELIAGHRRRQAVKYLVEECGREEYAMMPVHVERDGDLMSEIKLILTNCGARTRTDWERMMEVTRLTDLLKAMQTGSQEEQNRFREWLGLEPGLSGRELRKLVAELTGMSETKVAQLNHINNSLAPEMMDKFQNGQIGVSVANEAAGLPPEKQQELADQNEVKLADVKAVSESDTGEENAEAVSESDTGEESAEAVSESDTGKGNAEVVSESDTGKGSAEAVSESDTGEGNAKAVSESDTGEGNAKAVSESDTEMEMQQPATIQTTMTLEEMLGGTEPEEQPEKLSAYGTPKRVYAEGSLLDEPSCEGGHYCFSCAEMDCDIRGANRNCWYAPCGNPFSCEIVVDGDLDLLTEQLGACCQFVNHDLAYHYPSTGAAAPCCSRCENPCEWACERATAEKGKEEVVAMSQQETPPVLLPPAAVQEEESEPVMDSPEYDRELLNEMILDQRNQLEQMGDGWKKNVPKAYTKHRMMLRAYKMLLEAQDAAVQEPEPVEQPELPILKNNDQRKAWLRDYKPWGVWYTDEHIGSTFYKYDFACGARLIVEEFVSKYDHGDFTHANYHLIGGPEPPKGSYGIRKWNRHEEYEHYPDNETELVEFLKWIQKGE